MKPWQGKTVVIVDDSPQVRESLRATYEAIGMTVVGVAENGSVGLDLVRKHSPYLVSLDVIMPEMDGIECYKKLKAINPSQRIVMVTWIGSEAKILENLSELIPAHLFQAKPVSPQDLEARLHLVHNPPVPAKPDVKAQGGDDTELLALDMLDIKVS